MEYEQQIIEKLDFIYRTMNERLTSIEENIAQQDIWLASLEEKLYSYQQETNDNLIGAQGERDYMYRMIQGMQNHSNVIQTDFRRMSRSVDGIYTLLAGERQERPG